MKNNSTNSNPSTRRKTSVGNSTADLVARLSMTALLARLLPYQHHQSHVDTPIGTTGYVVRQESVEEIELDTREATKNQTKENKNNIALPYATYRPIISAGKRIKKHLEKKPNETDEHYRQRIEILKIKQAMREKVNAYGHTFDYKKKF